MQAKQETSLQQWPYFFNLKRYIVSDFIYGELTCSLDSKKVNENFGGFWATDLLKNIAVELDSSSYVCDETMIRTWEK